jgi:hypothetical protein
MIRKKPAPCADSGEDTDLSWANKTRRVCAEIMLKQYAGAGRRFILKSSRSCGNSVPGSRARLKNIARFFHDERVVIQIFYPH